MAEGVVLQKEDRKKLWGTRIPAPLLPLPPHRHPCRPFHLLGTPVAPSTSQAPLLHLTGTPVAPSTSQAPLSPLPPHRHPCRPFHLTGTPVAPSTSQAPLSPLPPRNWGHHGVLLGYTCVVVLG
eukprot:354060-Chlamydomonas_euryale.AAC.18